MKTILSLMLLIIFASCVNVNNPLNKTIDGNGNVTAKTRSTQSFDEIKCSGSYDVQLTQGSPASVKVDADDNLQQYIITDYNGNELNVRTQNDVNINPSKKIKLYITVAKLQSFKLSGSGDVTTANKFTGADHLDLNISGSGNIHFDVNTPAVSSNISGSGDIYVTGETKDAKAEIAGSGNYHAKDLKAENVTIKIAGTGDADVYADNTLDINIAGIGNVTYKGNATVTQKIAGSGKIKQIQ